jgi:hypothetical protein
MVRIDEIYYNVFVSALQHQSRIGLHWFDPFGSKYFKDLVSRPCIEIGHRILFWDQEPLYRDDAKVFFDQFCEIYRPPRKPPYHTTITLVTSELNSRDVQWVQDTYKIENTAHYFFHGWAALDWYRGYNHSFLSQPWPDRKFDHAFICPNNIVGGRRSHRLRLLSELGKRGCINHNLISFPAHCPYENKSVENLFQEHDLPFPENLSLPLIIDHDCNHANNSHRIDFWTQAMKCFCHVVTETVYDDSRIHITEKTFKPIVLQQPFLIVGNRGALKYLRDYGFRTFGDLWDEGYDDLDHEHRISAVADICRDITSWSPYRMRQAQYQIADTVKYNHDWFYGGFQDRLWKELCGMIDRWQ